MVTSIIESAPFIPPTAQQRVIGNKDTIKASDFLQLLVTQLTNQDPLDPMDDKEFMAQMAQFSSLEEMSSLNQTMTAFTQSQQASVASAYLGRDVTILGEDGKQVEGEVTAVTLGKSGEQSQVTVDGKLYDTSRIQIVRLNV